GAAAALDLLGRAGALRDGAADGRRGDSLADADVHARVRVPVLNRIMKFIFIMRALAAPVKERARHRANEVRRAAHERTLGGTGWPPRRAARRDGLLTRGAGAVRQNRPARNFFRRSLPSSHRA